VPLHAHSIPRVNRPVGFGAGLLILLGCLAFAGANAALWINGVALNSQKWVKTVAPLHTNEPVASAVATAVVGRVMEQSDPTALGASAGASPGQSQYDARVRRTAVSVCRQLITTPQFGVVWRQANQIAHREALALIGRNRDPNPGSVVLPLDQLASELDAALISRGIVLFPEGRPARIGDFTVLDNGQRSELRQAAGVIDATHIILPLLAVALLVLGFVLARNQARAVALAGAGIAIACGLSLVAVHLGPGIALHAIGDPDTRRAANQVTTALLSTFVKRTVVITVLALVVAAAAVVGGRIRPGAHRSLASSRSTTSGGTR
jgi:hypothetical protein